MNRNIIATASLAAFLFAGTAFAQEAHGSASTTPDVPVSVTDNKAAQQQLAKQAHASHEQEKSDKAQRKALKQQDKAAKAAAKADAKAN